MKESHIPKDLDDAIDILRILYRKEVGEIEFMDEKEFRGKSHMVGGMFIRNNWFLWWHENHPYKDAWPEEIPPIVEFFHEKGIVHGDDISGIIMTSLHRDLSGEEIDLEGQIKHYQDFWKAKGFEDGIPK